MSDFGKKTLEVVFGNPELFTETDITGSHLKNRTLEVVFTPDIITNAGKFQKVLFVDVFLPVQMHYATQYYEEIYKINWEEYVDTELAEFIYYEVHRSDLDGFTPVLGDPATAILQSYVIDNTTYYDSVPVAGDKYYYRIFVVLASGGAILSEQIENDRKPVWDVPYTDALIKNDGSDGIPMLGVYLCQCDSATDPDAHSVNYYYEVCCQASSPLFVKANVGTFPQVAGVTAVRQYWLMLNNRVICDNALDYGVWVNGVRWTHIGDDRADFAGYGPTDKVYIYDEKNYMVIFGDNTNGLMPTAGDTIAMDYSPWTPIVTADPLTNQDQTWSVLPATYLYISLDVKMRVAPLTTVPYSFRGYSSISASSFAIYDPPAPPTLVAPLNTTENSFQPVFQFFAQSPLTTTFKYQLVVSTTTDLSGIVQNFSQITNPEEWMETEYDNGEMVYFVPSYARKLLPDGVYYWWVYAYDQSTGLTSEQSIVGRFTIEGGTTNWGIGLSGAPVDFLPRKGGYNVTTIHVGRELTEKHVFTIDWTPMEKAQRDALFTEFSRRTILTFLDNLGSSFQVYWGYCDRNISGKAHPSRNPEFGIEQINYIPGQIRYGGQSVFTEV